VGGERRCFNLAQKCGIKSLYGMMIHSQYDISWADLKDCFDMYEFDIAYSVLLFDVSVFYKDEGMIESLKVSFRKRQGRIYFSFVGDPSLS